VHLDKKFKSITLFLNFEKENQPFSLCVFFLCYNIFVRLFIAVEIPIEIKQQLLHIKEQSQFKKLPVKWVEEENLHLTLKFIGEFPEKRLPELKQAILKGIYDSGGGEISLTVRGIGFFHSKGNVRVIWAGIEADQALQRLVKNLDAKLSKLGIKPEEREFVPHLTLARAKGEVKVLKISEHLKLFSDKDYGGVLSKQIILMRSELFSSGPKYTKIEEFNLVCSSN